MSQSFVKRALMTGVSTLVAASAVAVVSVSTAQAGAFGLREQSAVGQGSSFAGVAAGGSLSSMFWNPATMTAIPGTGTESVMTAIIPRAKLKSINIPGTLPGDVARDAVLPASYGSSQITDDLFVGFSMNTPFGLTTKVDPGTATAFHAATSEIMSIDAKLNVAYRINDMVSVGAGLGVQYFDVRLTSQPAVFANPALTGYQELKGDDFAPSYSLGVKFTPMDGTDIGIGFRGAVFHKLEGTQSFSGPLAGAIAPLAGTSHNISAKLTTPEKLTVGIRQRVSDAFTMMAGFEWTNWSRIGAPPIVGSPIPGAALALHYEDAWYASVGGEYKYDDNLTLRGGVGFEKSPIPVEHRNMRLADSDRLWVSAGLSYQVSDKLGIDLGYSHLFVEDTDVSGATPSYSYKGKSEAAVDIISASLRYQWKPEPMFANDDPIVRKY